MAAVHQLRAAREEEPQTEVELWPEKGEDYDAFMHRCVIDLSVCVGPDKAVESCDSKWRASERLGKKTMGQLFVTKKLDLGSAAVEACGTSCTGCSREQIAAKARAEARATIVGARAELRAAVELAAHRPESGLETWRRQAAEIEQAERAARAARHAEEKQTAAAGEVARRLAGQAEVNQDLVKAIGAVCDAVARGSDRLDELERENKGLRDRVKQLERAGKSKLILPDGVR